MKNLLTFSILVVCLNGFSQSRKTISYQTYIDLQEFSYNRLMKTADSLVAEYQIEPFDFQRENGSCCDKGLTVIKAFYKQALSEKKGDEDALLEIKGVEELIDDEYLLTEEDKAGNISAKADKYTLDGYYKRALLLYNRALELDPSSKSIKKKIKACKKLQKKHQSS